MDFLQLGGECSDQFGPYLSFRAHFPILAVHGALQDAYGECLNPRHYPSLRGGRSPATAQRAWGKQSLAALREIASRRLAMTGKFCYRC
jgi:hypothetical protein